MLRSIPYREDIVISMPRMGREEGNRDLDERRVGKYTMSVTVMLTGIVAHRLRRFEEFGLLSPLRTEAGQRLFSDWEIKLIREIARIESEGVNLRGVRVILEIRRGERE